MIALVVNGRTVSVDCTPDRPLLHAIRDGGPAGLAATPTGCLIGMCGVCTVHLDGQAVVPLGTDPHFIAFAARFRHDRVLKPTE